MRSNRIPIWFVPSVIVLAVLSVFMPRDVLTFNRTDSVPIGLYRAVPKDKATYVSFCLRSEHRVFRFYEQYCSPDNLEGTRVLKRVRKAHANGDMIVEGDVYNAIDSRVLGPITPAQQRGYWRALLVF